MCQYKTIGKQLLSSVFILKVQTPDLHTLFEYVNSFLTEIPMLDKNIIKIYAADYLYKLKTDFLEWFYPNLALEIFMDTEMFYKSRF